MAKKLLNKQNNLMTICQDNLYDTKNLLKQDCNKNIKSKNNTLVDKILLNNKYFKIN